MKKNFRLNRHFYWSLPREVRRNITDEAAAGFAIYNFIQITTPREFRKQVRAQGYKNVRQFMLAQMPKH